MKRKILIVLSFTLLSACGQGEPEGPDAVADEVVLVTVDGEPITLSMLERVMAARGVSEDEHERMRELLDELVRMQAVANAAREERLQADSEVRADLRLAELRTLYGHYVNQAQRARPVTDEEIEAVYRAQLERSGDRQYRIEIIRYADQAQALSIIDRLERDQASFDALRQAPGDGGEVVEAPLWIDPSQVPPGFARELPDTATGEVVPRPLETGQGWHVVRVVDTRPLDVPALEEVREGIARSLLQRQREAMIQSLYEQAEITPMLPLGEAEPD